MCYILRSNEGRYKKLLDDLKSLENCGRDEYPETLTNAFNLLVRESGEYDTVKHQVMGSEGVEVDDMEVVVDTCGGRGLNSNNEHTFSRVYEDSSTKVVPGIDGATHQGITCYGCQFLGHYHNQCPYCTRSGSISMHVGYTFTQGNVFFNSLELDSS